MVNFQEAPSNDTVYLNTCCSAQVDNPEGERPGNEPVSHQDRHAGSTVLAIDLDADNMMDLVLGDAGFSNLLMMMNGGTTPNTNSPMISYDPDFPSYDVPVDLPIYPAAFYVDMNNDGG